MAAIIFAAVALAGLWLLLGGLIFSRILNVGVNGARRLP